MTLPQPSVRPFTSQFRVELSNTIATGANSKNIAYRLYGSNEANGANATQLGATFTVAGNATKHAVSSRELYLPPESDKKYIFGSATGEADGGNAGADGTFTVSIVI